jgi:hypothetical protein
LTIITNLKRGNTTSLSGIALFESTFITIIFANNGCLNASSDVVRLDARSGVANVGGSAIDGNILASNSGGIHNSTQISGTGIAIIAVTRLATALTITITSIAPIKVSTVDFKGGSQLEFRQDSVTFAIEKVESVIVSRSKTISSGNSIE